MNKCEVWALKTTRLQWPNGINVESFPNCATLHEMSSKTLQSFSSIKQRFINVNSRANKSNNKTSSTLLNLSFLPVLPFQSVHLRVTFEHATSWKKSASLKQLIISSLTTFMQQLFESLSIEFYCNKVSFIYFLLLLLWGQDGDAWAHFEVENIKMFKDSSYGLYFLGLCGPCGIKKNPHMWHLTSRCLWFLLKGIIESTGTLFGWQNTGRPSDNGKTRKQGKKSLANVTCAQGHSLRTKTPPAFVSFETHISVSPTFFNVKVTQSALHQNIIKATSVPSLKAQEKPCFYCPVHLCIDGRVTFWTHHCDLCESLHGMQCTSNINRMNSTQRWRIGCFLWPQADSRKK